MNWGRPLSLCFVLCSGPSSSSGTPPADCPLSCILLVSLYTFSLLIHLKASPSTALPFKLSALELFLFYFLTSFQSGLYHHPSTDTVLTKATNYCLVAKPNAYILVLVCRISLEHLALPTTCISENPSAGTAVSWAPPFLCLSHWAHLPVSLLQWWFYPGLSTPTLFPGFFWFQATDPNSH